MPQPITAKQTEVLKFIQHFKSTFSYAPSTRDIQDKFKFKSQTSAMNYLRSLSEKGYIERPHKKARALGITAEGHAILLSQNATS